jgi:hypothetical protein
MPVVPRTATAATSSRTIAVGCGHVLFAPESRSSRIDARGHAVANARGEAGTPNSAASAAASCSAIDHTSSDRPNQAVRKGIRDSTRVSAPNRPMREVATAPSAIEPHQQRFRTQRSIRTDAKAHSRWRPTTVIEFWVIGFHVDHRDACWRRHVLSYARSTPASISP